MNRTPTIFDFAGWTVNVRDEGRLTLTKPGHRFEITNEDAWYYREPDGFNGRVKGGYADLVLLLATLGDEDSVPLRRLSPIIQAKWQGQQ